MFSRALLVLLLVLNAGVAAWWLLRPAAPPAIEPALPAGPTLQLVSERATARESVSAAMAMPRPPASTVSVRPASAATSTTPATATADAHCLRLGPFASEAALARAQSALQPLATRMAIATVPATARGWRVWLPPQADQDAAQAMATRIGAAGFDDYYVVPDGAEANSIALGRYGNEAAAQRRAAQLQAAGFAAQAQPLGAVTRWVDIATDASRDDAALRAASGAAQSRARDCAGLH